MPEKQVVIPEGVSPGDEFLARVAGKTITVKCPENGEPGQTLMVAFDAPRPCSGEPKSRVKLSIELGESEFNRGQNSNGLIVVLREQFGGGEWVEKTRTEILPSARKTWIEQKAPLLLCSSMDYYFEAKQKLQITIQEWDIKGEVQGPTPKGEAPSAFKLAAPLLASAESTLGRIVGSHKGVYRVPLSTSDASGGLVVRAEEIKGDFLNGDTLTLTFKGVSLAAKDPYLQGGKSDPYLKILRPLKDGQTEAVYTTETISNTLNPEWKSFTKTILELCNGNLDAPLLIECWDYDAGSFGIGARATGYNDGDDQIGLKTVTVRQLINEKELQLDDYKERKTKIDPGKLVWESKLFLEKRVQAPSFMDYFRGGYEMKVSVAIDFTGSNGDPKSKSSLHYIQGPKPNGYQQALASVLEILLEYDSDDTVDLMGFGGLARKRQVSHCFPLTEGDYSVKGGVQGVLGAYKDALSKIGLSGPTNFAEVIRHVVSKVQASGGVESKEYNVLLILTDGAITDTKATASEIVHSSELPMSIIIVGIGPGNFGEMKKMDGDDASLQSMRGTKASRDIVQFVPFREFDGLGDDAGDQLSAHVLAELPDQFLQFMSKWKIQPGGDWSERYIMPEGDWYAQSKVASRDLDFDPVAASDALAGKMASALLLNSGVDEDRDATPDTAIYPEGFEA